MPVTQRRAEHSGTRLDTFLFDIGGVLVNDLEINYETSARIFKLLGKQSPTKEEYLANLNPIQKLYRFVGLDEEESRRSSMLFRQTISENIGSIAIHSDVRPTLEKLKDSGIKLGIVSAYSRENADQLLSRIGISAYFDTVVGFEDSDEQKPSPKPVVIALDRLGSTQQTSVFVGDMKQDIIAGRSAGVKTVGIYRGKQGYHSRDMLQDGGPDLIIEDLNELTKLLL